jgi:uncharacterized membrane protein YfcA
VSTDVFEEGAAVASPTSPAEPIGASMAPARKLGGATLLGAVSGIFSGLLGIGGGLIMVPGLVIGMRQSQHVAHATSLAAIIPTAVAGVFVFGGASSVSWSTGLTLAVASIPGAGVGAVLMKRIPQARLRVIFGVFVVVIAAIIAVRG